MPTTTTMPDTRILLEGVRFETYEKLVDEVDSSGIKLTYDRGRLEIMSPSMQHESWKTYLARMVEAMTEELGIEIRSGGSTTFKRRDLEKGVEPDECYWIRNEPRMRDRTTFDPAIDPGPDLVVESESSRSLLDRLGILAALGAQEAWRYDGERLIVMVRDEAGRFVESPTSHCFPWLPVAEFQARLRKPGEPETTWIRGFRAWVRDRVAPLV